MPDSETFNIEPIGKFIHKYMNNGQVSIDPFARNCTLATYTNDLNPKTTAGSHEDVLVWLERLLQDGIKPDIVLFDPPYSLRQMKEMYQGIGIDKLSMDDTQRLGHWKKEKDVIAELGPEIVLSFGWNSGGMGKGRGFEIIEIMNYVK